MDVSLTNFASVTVVQQCLSHYFLSWGEWSPGQINREILPIGKKNREGLNTARYRQNKIMLALDEFQCVSFIQSAVIILLIEHFILFYDTGEKPDPEQTFKLTSLQNFSSCLNNSCTVMVNNHNVVSHRQPDTVLMETPQDTIVSSII